MTIRDGRVDRKTALLAGAGVVGAIAEIKLNGLTADAASAGKRAQRASGALNTKALDAAMQAKGEMMPGGVYSFSMGRQDLNVSQQGIKLEPDFALEAEANFVGLSNGSAMVGGEIPLRETEVNGTISRLLAGGLQLAAVHNHRIMIAPHVIWVHFQGQGSQTALASAVNRALPPSGKFDRSGSKPETSPLPAKQLGSILGGDVRIASGGVVEVDVERTDQIRINGIVVPPAAGVEHIIYFQPIGGGRAVLAAETPLTASEVQPVTRVYRQNGIEISALHNHFLNDQPRLFYMHASAVGNAVTLANIVRTALDNTASKRGSGGRG